MSVWTYPPGNEKTWDPPGEVGSQSSTSQSAFLEGDMEICDRSQEGKLGDLEFFNDSWCASKNVIFRVSKNSEMDDIKVVSQKCIKVVSQKWMVKLMKNPTKMDDLGGKPTIFGNIHMNMISSYGCGLIWSCTTMTSHVTVFTFGLGKKTPPFFKSPDGAPKEKGGPWAPKKKNSFIFFILWKETLGPSRC